MYEEIENELGCKIPDAIKYIDPDGLHAALLINERTGEVIAYGINKRICTMNLPHDGCTRYTVHAEQEMLCNYTKIQRQLKFNGNGRGQKTLVSLRFNRNGVSGNSKICSACAKMITNKCRGFIRNVKYMDDTKNWREVPVSEICDIAIPSSGDKRRNRSLNMPTRD